MSVSATPPDAEIRFCLGKCCVMTMRTLRDRVFREPPVVVFCERSKNCKLFAYFTFQHIVNVTRVAGHTFLKYAPTSRKGAGFRCTVLVSKSISKSVRHRVEEDNVMKEQAFLSRESPDGSLPLTQHLLS